MRSPREQQFIDEAKALLMEEKQLPEEDAHRYIQKISMDSGRGLVETARMILSMKE